MLDKNGKDIVTEVIEDAKNQTAQAEANATIFGKMFNFYARHCIIIRYDYRLVATEVVVSLAVVLLCIIVYLTAGIETKADPTLAIKSSFLTSQVIALGVTAIIAIVYNLIVKTKEVLIVMLKLLVAISIIILASSIIYKIKMDKTYDKNFYHSYFKEEAYKEYGDGEEKRVGITIAGIKSTTVEDDYVQRCMNSYMKFTIKTIILFMAYVVEIGVLIALIVSLSKKEKMKDDIEKDDKILFDDEINCRY